MKSIDKLREYVDRQQDEYNNHNVSFVWQLSTIANEIEAEIAERYMRLPVDANNEPIHVGDNLHSDETGRNFPCRGYNLTLQGSKKWWTVECCYDSYSGTSEYVSAKSCRHFKPRTLEDVLNDYLQEREKIVRKLESSLITLGEAESEEDACDKLFAERIRKLLGSGAE